MTPRTPEAQTARAVLMVRPESFASNPETLDSNHFQAPAAAAGPDPSAAAQRELDRAAAALEATGVAVHVLPGSAAGATPDEIFPNNWVSFHADGTAVLYPMLAPSRRRERRADILEQLRGAEGYRIDRVVDLTHHELRERYLEGTGSMVLDRGERVAYACLSARTHPEALADFGRTLGYEIVAFEAVDRHSRPIYHTNAMMSVGKTMAVICSDALADSARDTVLERLRETGREIIEIDFSQLHAFAGNLLELDGARGAVIALSARASSSLDDKQRRRLAAHGELLALDVSTIEAYGGGSVRCMLAEVHLPRDVPLGHSQP